MRDCTFALALAGGGARGAYQAGALLALAEHGFRFRAVAGTSIGALNGAWYAQGDGSAGHQHRLCEHWRDAARVSPLQLNPDVSALFSEGGGGVFGLLGGLVNGDLSVFHSRPITDLVDRWLDYEAVCKSHVPLTVAVLPDTGVLWDILSGAPRPPRFFRAHELGPAELRAALLAATAIPLALPAWKVQGKTFSDAGLAVPLPLRALYEDGHRHLLGIVLGPHQRCELLDFPDALCHYLCPSAAIDDSFLSMFDFSPLSVDRLIDMGHDDAVASLHDFGSAK